MALISQSSLGHFAKKRSLACTTTFPICTIAVPCTGQRPSASRFIRSCLDCFATAYPSFSYQRYGHPLQALQSTGRRDRASDHAGTAGLASAQRHEAPPDLSPRGVADVAEGGRFIDVVLRYQGNGTTSLQMP